MKRSESHQAVCTLMELSSSPQLGAKRPLEPPKYEIPKKPRGDPSFKAEQSALLLSPNTVGSMAVDLNLISPRPSPQSSHIPQVLLTPSTMTALSAGLGMSGETSMLHQRGEATPDIMSKSNLKVLSSFLADESPDSITSRTPMTSAPWLSSQLPHLQQLPGRSAEKSGSYQLLSGLGASTGPGQLTTRWQASVCASLEEKDAASKALLAPVVSCNPSEVPERLQRVSSPQIAALPAEPRILVQQFLRYLAARQGETRPQPVRTTKKAPREVLSCFDQLSRGSQRPPAQT